MVIDQLKNLVRQISPNVDLDNINENTQLVSELGFDSLAIMMLAMEIEEAFKISFDGPVEFQKVKDVLDFLKAKGIAD